MIWRADSTDGADHGESCAAFASLTLELGARAAGEQSWVTGGGSYPWPLQRWADVRVEPNPASEDVISVQQDAQAHHRWHPLGDGYRPQPGDWVLFDGHVEAVTGYGGGSLETIGGDSLPGFTVNAHTFPAPLAARGVLGFVNNGDLASVSGADGAATLAGAAAGQPAGTAPGTPAWTPATESAAARAEVPGVVPDIAASAPAGAAARAYSRHEEDPGDGPGTAAQRAFIALVAPGAIAAEQRYGVPAAVTIAQAIDESGWGRSELATADRNLFGIKGTGPACRDVRPTQEYENGVWVTQDAAFRVYRTVAESIEDHGRLLATGAAYRQAMASRHQPDAFAKALTGVYATNPDYGPDLIALMRMFDLYRYDAAAGASSVETPAPATAAPASGQGGRRPAAGEHSRVAGALAVAVRRTRTAAATATATDDRQRTGGPPMRTHRYIPRMPPAVTADFVATAKNPLTRGRPLYQDVARRAAHRLGAAGGLRLDAVPGAAAVLPRVRREAGHAQPRRHGVPEQVSRPGAVRQRPGRPGQRGLRDPADLREPPVGAGAGRRVRGVPVGRAARGPRRLGHGVPVLGRRPDRPAPEDALARGWRPGRAGQAGHAVP